MKKVTFESALKVMQKIASREATGIDLCSSYFGVDTFKSSADRIHIQLRSSGGHYLIAFEARKRSVEEGGCLFDGTVGETLHHYSREARIDKITEAQYNALRDITIECLRKDNQERYEQLQKIGFEVVDLNEIEEM